MAAYLAVLFLMAYLTAGRGRVRTDRTFFLADRRAPWPLVAIGLLGDSISGVTFVSVPGMILSQDMTYMQMVFGFFVGYIVVACVLLPLYYRLRLTSIYTYLDMRFGREAQRTGALFFIGSRLVGTAAKMYLIAYILYTLIFAEQGISFAAVVGGIIIVVWLYTFRGGMKTLIWTDALQTLCVLAALICLFVVVMQRLDMNVSDVWHLVRNDPSARVFEWGDWSAPNHFVKHFVSGILIVVVMTGLDQNIMQKNLACRTYRSAQKNMLCYGFGFIPLNFLFLTLGLLLVTFATQQGISLIGGTDTLVPLLATEHLGNVAFVCFVLGITTASFSNIDSVLTAMTTSVCVDLLDTKKKAVAPMQRTMIHLCVCALLFFAILWMNTQGNQGALEMVLKAASYTYGPLLGLYVFGLYTKRAPRNHFIMWVCLLAPALSFLTEWLLKTIYAYQVGYEILLFNGILTFVGLLLISIQRKA